MNILIDVVHRLSLFLIVNLIPFHSLSPTFVPSPGRKNRLCCDREVERSIYHICTEYKKGHSSHCEPRKEDYFEGSYFTGFEYPDR